MSVFVCLFLDKQIWVEPPPTAFAAQCPRLSVDNSCPQGAQQQTSRTPPLLSIDGTDRQTNGQTLDRCTDPVPHAMRAARKNTLRKDGAVRDFSGEMY